MAISAKVEPGEPIHDLRARLVKLVRQKDRDLTLRQIAVILICNDSTEFQTVRSLASHLNIHKPGVTRAVDRLEEEGFVARKADHTDRRSVLISVTRAGKAYCASLSGTISGGE